MVTEITMSDMKQPLGEKDDSIFVVLFYGTTCGPCKATIPNYEQASSDIEAFGSRIKCFKIDAWTPDEQREYCRTEHGITGVPHFKAFCRQEMIYEKVGGGDLNEIYRMFSAIADAGFKKFGEKY